MTLIEINELIMNSKSRLMQIFSSLKQRPASKTLDIHLKKTNESFKAAKRKEELFKATVGVMTNA
jgi:hypothetical protein